MPGSIDVTRTPAPCRSLRSPSEGAERLVYARRGDRFWLLGCALLFLDPSLVLFSIRLLAVAYVWLALWLVYVLFVIRYFAKVETPREV